MAEKIKISQQKPFESQFSKKDSKEVFFVKTESPNQNSHWHDYFEIDFVISGEVTQIINGAETKAEKGAVFLMLPDNSHQTKTESNSVVYSLLFGEDVLSERLLDQMVMGESGGSFRCTLYEADVAFLKPVFERIESENQNKKANHNEIVNSLVNVIVGMLLRNSSAHTESDKKHLVVRRAMAFIKKNYASNPSLLDVANFVHMEASYFSVFFKEKAGISFKRYLNEIKLESAAKKLKTTATPIIDVCYSSGFESLSNFHRKFKEKYGVTPKEFRDGIK